MANRSTVTVIKRISKGSLDIEKLKEDKSGYIIVLPGYTVFNGDSIDLDKENIALGLKEKDAGYEKRVRRQECTFGKEVSPLNSSLMHVYDVGYYQVFSHLDEAVFYMLLRSDARVAEILIPAGSEYAEGKGFGGHISAAVTDRFVFKKFISILNPKKGDNYKVTYEIGK